MRHVSTCWPGAENTRTLFVLSEDISASPMTPDDTRTMFYMSSLPGVRPIGYLRGTYNRERHTQRDKTSGKRKQRTSPQLEGKQAKKKKDSGPSPSYKKILKGHGNKKPTNRIKVQSKKEKRRQHTEQLSKQPLKQPLPKPQQSQLKHKRQKPQKSPLRPNALIIRPS
ncbi:hypothetical protein EVAR_916_1 [Eumeta japonica]|uniref:Uncharacterized protein n=1 Tax=Eumeta variegata TaxID=151549 RepID=A0A4C1SDU3_EUMVA|nr:hypothetical protein EVAR_916_1 [Eumeta japonica]